MKFAVERRFLEEHLSESSSVWRLLKPIFLVGSARNVPEIFDQKYLKWGIVSSLICNE
jgi:hypothetical protein